MRFLDGVYVERPEGPLRVRRTNAPTSVELTLTSLTPSLALRIARFLERQALGRDAEDSCIGAAAIDHVTAEQEPAT